jgi:hypothetical protein
MDWFLFGFLKNENKRAAAASAAENEIEGRVVCSAGSLIFDAETRLDSN